MISFQDYRKKVEEETFEPQFDVRSRLEDVIALISNMEPKDIADNKELLIELQSMLEGILTGQND